MALDFSFSKEQDDWREYVREFANKELKPHTQDWDSCAILPREAIRAMGKAGILGVIGPKDLGGQGMDYVSLGIAIEELAAVDISCSLIAWHQATHTHFLPGWGDDVIRQVHAGECVVALATSEKNAGSDLSAIQATAEREGEDYILEGEKVHVSTIPGADILAVSAKVHAEGEDKPKMILLKVPTNSQGVTVEMAEQMGAKAHSLGTVRLNQVRVPVAATLGNEGEGKSLMYARFNVSRCLSPIAALGCARSVLKETIKFVSNRHVFGRPIGVNQSISFPIVEHHTRIEAGRLLAYKALVANDRGEDASEDAAMAKWFGISTGLSTIQECLQMFGAQGYLKEQGIEQKLRDVQAFLFTGGTMNIMKILLVRHVMGPEFAGLRS